MGRGISDFYETIKIEWQVDHYYGKRFAVEGKGLLTSYADKGIRRRE
jgi:hypothetical protein